MKKDIEQRLAELERRKVPLTPEQQKKLDEEVKEIMAYYRKMDDKDRGDFIKRVCDNT